MKRAKLRRLEILELVQMLMVRIYQYNEEVEVNEHMDKDEKEKMILCNSAGYATLGELEMLIMNNIHPDEITITEMYSTETRKKIENGSK